jgi:predicted nucleic acid-binding protein
VVVFDSSILVAYLRRGLYQKEIDGVHDLVRNSSVVLAELWRGAKEPAERAFLERMEKNLPVLTPTEKNWADSGRLLARVNKDTGFPAEKLRDLHFDVLIALIARSYGARLITANRTDFELIRRYQKFDLEIWETAPTSVHRNNVAPQE